VDIDHAIVDRLNAGLPHIYEHHLESLLKEALKAGRFRAETSLSRGLEDAQLAMIAVGTPSVNGLIDLRGLRNVVGEIGAYIQSSARFLSVVVKSTVIPTTTDTVVRTELEAISGIARCAFGLGMNPEFLREGTAVDDFMNPDRIVLGYEDEPTLAALEELYAPWDCDKLHVNTRTAELIKYANNALLATQISAINELANLADAIGDIDIMEVVSGLHLDRRWNPLTPQGRLWPEILTYLIPGCGFGGSCFPKDVDALYAQGRERELPMHMLKAILDINRTQPLKIVEILERENAVRGANVLLLGLAFKPDTDDVRESASIPIAQSLLAGGAKVMAHDPIAADNFKRALGPTNGSFAIVSDWREHVSAANTIVIATKWSDYESLRSMGLRNKLVMDCRRMFSPQDFASCKYRSVGLRRE
jgi:UDPglucose 6-dehydrogenase/GDP-mannose 6-dehydrogenase